jgi:organic hydroperoxide reductase OsmC/OhrA
MRRNRECSAFVAALAFDARELLIGVSFARGIRMSIAPFPHRYVVSLSDDQLVAPPRAQITAGTPPQFGGSEQVWSPEELLVASVLLCVRTTFDAYARRDSLEVLDWQGTGTGTLVKGPGGPIFSAIDLDVTVITAPGDEARATELLEKSERLCIITRALQVPVHLHVTAKAVPAAS